MTKMMIMLMAVYMLILVRPGVAQPNPARNSKTAKDTTQNLTFSYIEIVGTVENLSGIYVLGGTGDAPIVLKIQRPTRVEADNIDRESFEEMTEYCLRLRMDTE